MKMPIYLDYNATTPVDPRVVEAMMPCMETHFGNPSSATHAYGWAAARLVDRGREQVAAALGVSPDEVVFTSGATEADNLAIKGVAACHRERGGHIVTSVAEHKAVLNPCRRLGREGFTVTEIPTDGSGRVDPAAVAAALRADTILVSIMLANNEIGTIQPIAEIAALCRARGVLAHTDATQAVGKIPVDVGTLGIDLLSLSAHKIYGPKGIGALVIRRRSPALKLPPLLDGGGHEHGMRSGTLNVPGVVGLGRAIEIASEMQAGEAARLAPLRDRLRETIVAALDGVVVNGDQVACLPNTLNLSFPGVDPAALVVGCGEIAVASGSACTSANPQPSHVLLALGRRGDVANASLRFSLGRGTAEADIVIAAAAVIREAGRLRRR